MLSVHAFHVNCTRLSPGQADCRTPPQVADFGLSRVLEKEQISTGTFGTVTHMPPELLTEGKLSKAVDVYAFGVVLWEMCTGKRPWGGLMQMAVSLLPPMRHAVLRTQW